MLEDNIQAHLPPNPIRPNDVGPLLFHASFTVDAHHSKKNGKVIRGRRYGGSSKGGRLFIDSNDRAKSGERYLVWRLRSHAAKFGHSEPISCPLLAVCLFYFPRDRFFTKKNQVSKTLPDLSNLYELPQDALQEAGIIVNDTQIKAHDGSRILWHDSPSHVITICLYEYKGQELLR